MARAELTQLIEMCRDVRQRLHRNNKVRQPHFQKAV